MEETIAEARKLIGKVVLYGICLGHQIIALALGAKTYKLKFGHSKLRRLTTRTRRRRGRKVVIIGSGPNRIGQGIEFDYCCVQEVFSLRGHNKLQPGDGEYGQGNGR